MKVLLHEGLGVWPRPGELQVELTDERLQALVIGLPWQRLGDGGGIIEPRAQPKRAALPPQLPRIEIHHEPESTTCACGCQLTRIGQDVAEKLDYIPGVAQVERHVRGEWACRQCETLTQAPVPAHVIDKGLATAGLLVYVLVAKYADHLPLYRLIAIFERAGVTLAVSTLADWVGA